MSYQLIGRQRWPGYSSFAGLPALAIEERLSFNAQTLGHYRETATVRYPVDAQRGLFNTRDFANVQAAFNAAAAYSLANPSGTGIVEFDQSSLLMGGGAVTIPGNTRIMLQGKDTSNYSLLGGAAYTFNFTATATETNVFIMRNVRNGGQINTAGSLDLQINESQQNGNVTIGERLTLHTQDATLSGIWTTKDIRFIGIYGGHVRHISGTTPWLTATAANARFIQITGTQLSQNGMHLFDITGSVAQFIFLTNSSYQSSGVLRHSGGTVQHLTVIGNSFGDSATGLAPYIDTGGVLNLVVNDNAMTATTGFIRAAIGGGGRAVQINGNSLCNLTPLASGALIELTGGTLGAVSISNNVHSRSSSPAHAYLASMTAAQAAVATMIGNRTSFTTALATNMPAIHGGLNI